MLYTNDYGSLLPALLGHEKARRVWCGKGIVKKSGEVELLSHAALRGPAFSMTLTKRTST